MSEKRAISKPAKIAVRRWGKFALHVRGEMRARGVRGDLAQMDRYVSTVRGSGYARFLADFVTHVRDVSRDRVPADVLVRELAELSADVVFAVYSQPLRVA